MSMFALGMSKYTEFVWEFKWGFVKAIISRAQRFSECLKIELEFTFLSKVNIWCSIYFTTLYSFCFFLFSFTVLGSFIMEF